MSIEDLDKTIPVSPPKEKRKINPNLQIKAGFNDIFEPKIVAIQLKILIPVGTAIIIVAAVK
jgi:hypothetical protein